MEDPCVVCGIELELVNDNKYQPYDGCEIKIIGAFGSRKYDKYMNGTIFRGVICDDCAGKFVPLMDEQSDRTHDE